MSNRALITGALVAIALVGVAALIYQQKAGGPERDLLPEPYQQFMACLPSEITEAERMEIRGILRRYYVTSRQGQVEANDHMEMGREMNGYVTKGSIDRNELNQFMIRVSYYTNRNDPKHYTPDGSGNHPLLDQKADSTR